MKVFALADLHLPGNKDKPMDIFGPAWRDHANKVSLFWRERVGEGDLVLVPGDLSWAMTLDDAADDIAFLDALPGTKLILRGNHDYWWSSLSKVRARLPESVFALQNDAFRLGRVTIAGSRGWVCPGNSAFSESTDRPIYERELMRLELSLKKAGDSDFLIGMLHYPPLNERHAPSGFSELLERYGVKKAVYGHLHDKACLNAFEGELNGVEYRLCSADHLGFAPALIAEI